MKKLTLHQNQDYYQGQTKQHTELDHNQDQDQTETNTKTNTRPIPRLTPR